MKKTILSLLPGGLFAVTAPVIFYVANPDNRILNSWTEIFGSMILTLAVTVILYGLAFLTTRSPAPAGVITSILVIGIFYLWQIALMVALIALVCVGALLLLHQKISFGKTAVLLGLISILLAGFYGGQLGIFLSQQPSIRPHTLVESVIPPQTSLVRPGNTPDIYYIILDGYGRADLLKNVYGYDNSEFLDELRGLGFFVAGASRANYPQTVLSVGSSLNMQYLDKMAAQMGKSNAWWLAKDALIHSQARQFLESQGYRTVFLASGFDYTDIRDGDEYIKPYPLMLNNFDAGFLRFTNLASLGDMGGLIPYPSYAMLRRVVQANFEALPQAASETGPKFVFAHITAPHPPFVFDESGNPVNPNAAFTMVDKMRDIMDAPTYKKSYIAELRYINAQTIKTIKSILANSAAPPVIILQGDHGPGLYLTYSAETSCLYERYSILNAYYLPGMPPSSVPETITPVNTFRMVFNDYFSTHFPLLPDKSYFASFTDFYAFQDVSAGISNTCQLK